MLWHLIQVLSTRGESWAKSELFHPTFWRILLRWPAWALFNHVLAGFCKSYPNIVSRIDQVSVTICIKHNNFVQLLSQQELSSILIIVQSNNASLSPKMSELISLKRSIPVDRDCSHWSSKNMFPQNRNFDFLSAVLVKSISIVHNGEK